MSKKTSITTLGINLFGIELYGKRGSEDTAYVRYNILAPDQSSAVTLAKEIATREGYKDLGLTIEPDMEFHGRVYANSMHLKELINS